MTVGAPTGTPQPPKLDVGDVGVVIGRGRQGHHYDATVVKVGRRWAYVEPKHLGRFDRETGFEDSSIGYGSVFYTAERMAHRERMIEANETIKACGLSFGMGSRWAEDDALALAAWLRERFPNGR